MANPLRWFRRHAKILMVVLGSAAMAIFGFGNVFDSMSRSASQPGQRETEVIAKWKGGDITRRELDSLQMRHFQMQRFLNEMQQQAFAKLGEENFRPLAQPIEQLREGQGSQQSMIDEQLIEKILLAKKAEEEGVIVSDGVIDDYLALAAGDAGFSHNDLLQINEKANQRGCSLENVRRHLRLELLAQQMKMYSFSGMTRIPNPIESMELYRQVSERVDCQILPVSVEQFIGKIGEKATEAELKKLYESGKFEYPDSSGKKPGFKIPDRVKVQYLVAEFETFLQNEMNKLTEEVVQKEYDRLVAEKDDSVMETIPDEKDESIKINDPPPGLPGADAVNKGESATDAVDPPPAIKDQDSPAKEADKQDGETTPTNDGNTENEKTEGDKKSDDQSLNVVGTMSQFVSLTNQDQDPNQSEGSEETPSQDVAPEVGEPLAPEKLVPEEKLGDPAANGATQEKSDTVPADLPEMRAENSQGDAAAENQSNPAGLESDLPQVNSGANQIGPILGDQEKKEIPKRVRPLKDVVERVKRDMVSADARKAMELAVNKANVRITGYHGLRMKWEYTDESKRGPEPEPVDANAIATEYNLVASETELVDLGELAKQPVGMIAVPMVLTMADGSQQRQFPLVSQIIFNRYADIKVYDPQTAVDFMSSNTYVYWLTEKADAKTPEFDACRPEVEKYWQSQKALELAKAEAQKIVENVKSQGKVLGEIYNERVTETGEFTWFTGFGGVNVSSPIGVTNAGDDFMKTVFALNKLEVAAAPNHTKDTIYVVQMMSDRKSVADVGNDYLENQFFKFKQVPRDVQGVAQWYGQELNYDWNQEFVDMMGLKYLGR